MKQMTRNRKGRGSGFSAKGGPAFGWGRQLLVGVLVLLLMVSLYSLIGGSAPETLVVPLSTVALRIEQGEVEKIDVAGDDLTITLQNGELLSSKKEVETSLTQTLFNYGVTGEQLGKVEITIANPGGFSFWLLNLLPFLIPIIFILIFFWYISRQVKGATMQAFTFGQSKAKIINPNDLTQKITFKDVAGVKEAKEELLEVVDFLKNPKKFLDIGARIPKGVLLMGAPGTGKTLLARAVAGEAHVPFLYLSGSDFVEMFVGVGASRVRDLFLMAKKLAPSIIFIDEIDAIGRHRGSGIGGGNDEREQTLNQILVEMDGFEPNEKLIVMAATNRPDVLDPALLRPGRFDRRIILDNPDIKDREEILQIYAIKKPMGPDTDLLAIAQRTPGFSGADLSNLMNEAAILAAREGRKEITQYDLIRSVEKVMLGPERKSHILSPQEKKITAYHEMGHALIASLLEHSDPVHKVSIISRGHAAGYTLKLPFEERRLQSRKEFLADLAVSLGGYATEKMVFGDITTGAANDIAVSTSLARDMVTKYGMSDKLGPIAFDLSGPKLFPGQNLGGERYSSESVSALVDGEVSRLMNEALATANDLLTNHRDALDDLAAELIKIETIDRVDFEKLLVVNGIKPKVNERIAPEETVITPEV
jgi:cell division protease FtsH